VQVDRVGTTTATRGCPHAAHRLEMLVKVLVETTLLGERIQRLRDGGAGLTDERLYLGQGLNQLPTWDRANAQQGIDAHPLELVLRVHVLQRRLIEAQIGGAELQRVASQHPDGEHVAVGNRLLDQLLCQRIACDLAGSLDGRDQVRFAVGDLRVGDTLGLFDGIGEDARFEDGERCIRGCGALLDNLPLGIKARLREFPLIARRARLGDTPRRRDTANCRRLRLRRGIANVAGGVAQRLLDGIEAAQNDA
jgi:hypothetical protein